MLKGRHPTTIGAPIHALNKAVTRDSQRFREECAHNRWSHIPWAGPYHPHWKMAACHLAYYELGATIDHIVPVTRSGAKDDSSNWVTTSMLHNAMKAHWTVAEHGWKLLPAGDFAAWDGMLPWFVSMLEGHTDLQHASYFSGWYRAAQQVLAEHHTGRERR